MMESSELQRPGKRIPAAGMIHAAPALERPAAPRRPGQSARGRAMALAAFAVFAPSLCRGVDDAPPRWSAVAGCDGGFRQDARSGGRRHSRGRPDGILHQDATGLADIAAEKPMRPDTIFWIASMTKPITATAILLLVDEGKLSVDDLVEKHIPEFSKLKAAGGSPAAVTIRHLLTHTSGMADITQEEAVKVTDLAGLMPLYAARPTTFKPGEKWAYCQSAINTAGRIVEVVSGMSFVDFLETRLFKPLGMKDTTFYLSTEQAARLAKSYKRAKDGSLEAAENFILLGKSATSRDRFPAANGGLFSTAGDYARFCRMILRRGELDGKRYLRPESVALMTSLQTADLKTGFTEGNGWGLGWCIVRAPQGVSAMLSPGSFGHGGAYGTQAWIDPRRQRAYILLVQRADFPNSDASEVRRVFQTTAAAAP
jgi:CubicO group peptidase (beta-lactamase class C family)